MLLLFDECVVVVFGDVDPLLLAEDVPLLSQLPPPLSLEPPGSTLLAISFVKKVTATSISGSMMAAVLKDVNNLEIKEIFQNVSAWCWLVADDVHTHWY